MFSLKTKNRCKKVNLRIPIQYTQIKKEGHRSVIYNYKNNKDKLSNFWGDR